MGKLEILIISEKMRFGFLTHKKIQIKIQHVYLFQLMEYGDVFTPLLYEGIQQVQWFSFEDLLENRTLFPNAQDTSSEKNIPALGLSPLMSKVRTYIYQNKLRLLAQIRSFLDFRMSVLLSDRSDFLCWELGFV